MKNMKLFISLVLVVIVCVVMAGCGSRPSSGNEGWNDPNKPANQEWSDPENPNDQSWSDPDDYENQDWNDPENYEDQDWRDPENPGTETTDPSETEHTGTYRHEIDGIVFYTEHDVEQWIGHQDGLGKTFDLEQMAKDIFGTSETDSWDATSIFPINGVTTSLEFNNVDSSGSTHLQAKEGVHPYIIIESMMVYDMGNGDGSEYYKPYYFINGSYHCTDYELIEITLYAFERWADGEYYRFENFSNSARIMVVNH